jgi:predicted alpha/beta-fold hydrolase
MVSQFDERLTVPLFGYSSVKEYYRAARNSDKLHKICIPYISITATDDPFVPEKCKMHVNALYSVIIL